MNREPRLQPGDVVSHFKRCTVEPNTNIYLYKIVCIAHNQQNQKQVVYQALYPPFKVWIRDYDEFMSELTEDDVTKYPTAQQKFRFELVSPAIV